MIPEDCRRALITLVYNEARTAVGVNDFVLLNTKHFMGHVTGWDCVYRKRQEAGLERRMNVTDTHHYITTEHYTPLDVASRDRDLFYKHIEHSEIINENIYQYPPAVRDVTYRNIRETITNKPMCILISA